MRTVIIPADIRCPNCGMVHIDKPPYDEIAHRKHTCQHCDTIFAVTVIGIGENEDGSYIGESLQSIKDQVDRQTKRLESLQHRYRARPVTEHDNTPVPDLHQQRMARALEIRRDITQAPSSPNAPSWWKT